jgi:hypothetical protein
MQCRLSLAEGGSLRIVNGAGIYLAVDSGVVWLTQERDARDWMLEEGRRHQLDRDGTAIISALRSARLTLSAPRGGVAALLGAAWRRLVAAYRAHVDERALAGLDARALRDIGLESYQPGLGQRLQEYKRLDEVRLRATLLGQL